MARARTGIVLPDGIQRSQLWERQKLFLRFLELLFWELGRHAEPDHTPGQIDLSVGAMGKLWGISKTQAYRDKEALQELGFLVRKGNETRNAFRNDEVGSYLIVGYDLYALKPPKGGTKRGTEIGTDRREEMEWRINQVWLAHLKTWRSWLSSTSPNGTRRPDPPFTEQDHRKPIREALLEFDKDLLGPDQREKWLRESAVRAAGMGIYHDPWCTGRAEGASRQYLEHWRPWRRQAGKAHPVPRFAECYWKVREAHERRRETS